MVCECKLCAEAFKEHRNATWASARLIFFLALHDRIQYLGYYKFAKTFLHEFGSTAPDRFGLSGFCLAVFGVFLFTRSVGLCI